MFVQGLTKGIKERIKHNGIFVLDILYSFTNPKFELLHKQTPMYIALRNFCMYETSKIGDLLLLHLEI